MCTTLLMSLAALFASTVADRLRMPCNLTTSVTGDKEWKPFPEQKSCEASFALQNGDVASLYYYPLIPSGCPFASADVARETDFRVHFSLGRVEGILPLDPNAEDGAKQVFAVDTGGKSVVAKFDVLSCTTLYVQKLNVFTRADLEGMVECLLDHRVGDAVTVSQWWWHAHAVGGYTCSVPLTDGVETVILPVDARAELVVTLEEEVYVFRSSRHLRIEGGGRRQIYDARPDAKMPMTAADGGRKLRVLSRKLMLSPDGDDVPYAFVE